MLRAKADWFNGRQATQCRRWRPINRTPYFCSGCPHNTSTKVPEGSRAFAGIGCHFMALWMDRSTETFTHMGGEGVPGSASRRSRKEEHVFANLGDGTYFHSAASRSVRRSPPAPTSPTRSSITTHRDDGGQHVDGDLSPQQITFQLHSEGIRDIYLFAKSEASASDSAAQTPSRTISTECRMLRK